MGPVGLSIAAAGANVSTTAASCQQHGSRACSGRCRRR